ncbi:nucleotide exchange factor GrpE [Streptomyces sp. NPDC000880]
MSVPNNPPPGDRRERPSLTVHDRRRIDPVTLQLRPDSSKEKATPRPGERDGPLAGRGGMGSGAAPTPAQMRESRERIAELTADLQRLKAEYDNYRKRVHRDRLAVRQIAVANVLARLLPVLDAVEQAREHGEVTGALTAVADVLESRLAALGLQPVGEPGEPFDPQAHQALTYTQSEGAGRPICTAVLRRGYRVGEQLLRPAQVSVSGPPAAAASEHGQG